MIAEALEIVEEEGCSVIGSCRVYDILWAGRTKAVAIYVIENLETGEKIETMASMGLWHMHDELIIPELELSCGQKLSVTRYAPGKMFLVDAGGRIWYDIRVRGT